MGKLYWQSGRIAATPYRLQALDVGICSVEELCFLIRERTELIDRSLMDESLLLFIEEKLGFPVAPLRQLVHFNGTLATFCQELLELSAFPMSGEEWSRVKKILIENETISPFEREIRRADALYGQQHYFKAFHVYGRLIPEAETDHQCAYLCGQMAKAAFFLFYYETAAEYFMRSYRYGGEDGMLLGYLLMKRFLLNREQYVLFATQNQEYYEMTLKAEQIYDRAWEKARARTDAMLTLPARESMMKEFREMME